MVDKTFQTETSPFDARVGGKVVIELQGVGGRFTTAFVGWEKGRYVQIKLPPKLDLLDHIYTDKPVIVRYLHVGGEVHAFKTVIQTVIHSPYRIIFLDFPSQVETINLRKVERVDCFIPAKFTVGDIQAPGYVLNLSQGGTRVSIDRGSHGLREKIVPEAAISCAFRLPAAADQDLTAEGVIKKIFQDRDKHIFSVEFSVIGKDAQKSIQVYIDEIHEYAGGPNECVG